MITHDKTMDSIGKENVYNVFEDLRRGALSSTQNVAKHMSYLYGEHVIVLADKDSNNIVFVYRIISTIT